MNKRRPIPPAIIALLAVTVLLDAIALPLGGGSGIDVGRFVLLGLCFAQMTLLGMWLALGAARWLSRTIVVFAGVAAWAAALRGALSVSSSSVAEIVSFLTPQVIAAALMALTWRGAGYRWPNRAPPDGPAGRRYQFSLAALLGLTAVVAVLSVLAKYADFPRREAVAFVSLYVLNTALGATAIWAFSPARPAWRPAALLAAGAAGGLLWSLALQVVPILYPVSMIVLESLFFAVWLAVCRAAGAPIARRSALASGERKEREKNSFPKHAASGLWRTAEPIGGPQEADAPARHFRSGGFRPP